MDDYNFWYNNIIVNREEVQHTLCSIDQCKEMGQKGRSTKVKVAKKSETEGQTSSLSLKELISQPVEEKFS